MSILGTRVVRTEDPLFLTRGGALRRGAGRRRRHCRTSPPASATGRCGTGGPQGRRWIPVTAFWRGFSETALEPGEVIVELRVPRTGSAGWGYEKFTRRQNDWPIVAAAAVQDRVALANMAGSVVRATATEEALAGAAWIAAAAALADEGLQPSSDMHADAGYRRHLARLLARRALEKAAA